MNIGEEIEVIEIEPLKVPQQFPESAPQEPQKAPMEPEKVPA